MPLKKGSSSKTISANVSELTKAKATGSRRKGIKTIAKRKGISFEEAKRVQSNAIAYDMARNKKKYNPSAIPDNPNPTSPTGVSPYTEAKRRTSITGAKRPSRSQEQDFFGTGYMPRTDIASAGKAMSRNVKKEITAAQGTQGKNAMDEMKKRMNRGDRGAKRTYNQY